MRRPLSVFLPGSGSPLLPASTPAACLHWSVADRQVVYSTPQPPAGAFRSNGLPPPLLNGQPMQHPNAATRPKAAPQYFPSPYNAHAKRSDGQSPPSPAFAGGWQPDISFRPLPYEALHSLTVAPSVTDRGWPHPTGCPVYAPARSPVEGI
jgi:hypothetical protein